MLKQYKAVIFDLDGTLLRSETGICDSLRYALRKMGVKEPGPEECRRIIGPPLGCSFRELFGMDEEQAARAVEYFNEYYQETGVFEAELYPEVTDLLDRLLENNKMIAVATSKSRPLAEKVFEHFGLSGYLTCAAMNPDHKKDASKADIIRQVLKECRVSPEEAVMIGDSVYDAEGAGASGTEFIGVLYGYGSGEEMRQAGGRKFAADIPELSKMLI
ncbi:HAD hydrolase-like protein [Anaerolentibacter hominis]|uniref:HAD hydrolase-like protein n=1 Tax=Anaerolentibacter hominis TaxID=3079009 RepID=UPI0031B833F1